MEIAQAGSRKRLSGDGFLVASLLTTGEMIPKEASSY